MARPGVLAAERGSESGGRTAGPTASGRPIEDGSDSRTKRATVLHLIDTGGPGGAETIYGDVASGLDETRWRSVVAIPETGWLDDSLRTRGMTPQIVPTGGSFDVGFVRRLDELVRKECVDLVHAHLLTSGVYGGLIGRLRRVPVICTLHGGADFGQTVPLRTVKMRLLDAFATRVVAVSDSLRRQIVEAGVRATRTDVIYNGIDTEAFAPGSDRSLRVELGIHDDEVLVGAVGNVRPSKDYQLLLRAAAQLRSSSARYRFVIAGDATGPLFDELIQLRGALGLDDIVTFIGFHRDVGRLMRNLDVFLITSTSEGFSLTTIQAMASGVPVVATRCGGPEEIIEDSSTGLLVPAGSPDGIVRAIHELASSANRRTRFVRAARTAVQQRFTTRAMLGAYQALYERCLSRKRQRRPQ